MKTFAISFLFSTISTLLIVRFSYLHEHITGDYEFEGVQKFHATSVPRIGGLCLFTALSGSLFYKHFQHSEVAVFCLILLFTSLPAFGFGLLEDLTKRVGIKARLLATATSAGFAGYFLDAWLSSLQILGIDSLMLQFPLVAIVLTCFAVAGVANAFNIIDGYNGLSGMVGLIILGGLAYVAFQLQDHQIMLAALAMMGAILGFLIWNYPLGKIFLGDGGAYLIGFWIAELSVLLTARHPEVSKWFPVLLCCYPLMETLFTIYRRVVIHRTHPGMPDASHLHQLIYKRVVRWRVGSKSPDALLIRNSLTSPFLWVLAGLAVIPAVMFWRDAWVLRGFVFVFVLVYVLIYRRIALFKVPVWVTIHSQNWIQR